MDGAEIRVERDSNQAAVVVSGEVDMTSAPRLEDEITSLVNGGLSELRIDLAGVSFMDSTGLRVLLKASKLVASSGGKFVLASPSEAVSRLLDVSGLSTHFEQS